MKLLFFTHYSDLYGANLSMLGLIEDLINRYNVEVYLICPKKGKLVRRAIELGVHVKVFKYIAWRTERYIIIKRILRVGCNSFFLTRIIKYTRRIAPDIIHSNTSVVDLGAVVAGELGIPFIWHFRELGEEDYNLKYLESPNRIHELFTSAKRIIAISDFLKEAYRCKYSELSIDTVYNGLKSFSVKKKKHVDFNFCIIGKIIENKGQFDAIKAVNELTKKGMKNIHLYLVGDGKKRYVRSLKKYLHDNKLESYISFCGYSNQIEKILELMDIGIMASKCEAFGRATVEYMLAELPVIATNTGATKEILGERALYYEFNDYIGLANQMKRCVIYYDDIKEFGKIGKTIAENKFCQRRCTDSIYSIYRKVLANEQK